MSATTTVPITITPEASEHIASLGYRSEFEEMLEHTLQVVRGIQRVEVFVTHDPEAKDIPAVIIRPWVEPSPNGVDDPTEREWMRWQVCKYPPQVAEHFLMMPLEDE